MQCDMPGSVKCALKSVNSRIHFHLVFIPEARIPAKLVTARHAKTMKIQDQITVASPANSLSQCALQINESITGSTAALASSLKLKSSCFPLLLPLSMQDYDKRLLSMEQWKACWPYLWALNPLFLATLGCKCCLIRRCKNSS